MNRIILFLIVITFFGCKDNSQKIENIEIMSYYYLSNEKQNKFEISAIIYAVSDEDGNAFVMKINQPMSNKYSFFETKIDNNIIDKISKDNLNKNEEFYNNPNHINEPVIYCGPIKRVKIKYKNGHQFSFAYTSERGKDFNDFVSLFKSIENFPKSISSEVETIKSRLKIFKEFAMKKDSTMLPFPPFPKKIDEVKFTKLH